MYEKFERLVTDAEFAICLLGNPQTSDFEMVDVSHLPVSEDHLHAMRARGMYFLGVTGLVNGTPRTALAVELENPTIDALASAFLAYFATVLDRPVKSRDESALQWLEELYALESSSAA